jgi:hypothetical protein
LLVRNGTLKATRLDPRALRISEQSIEEFIASQQVDPAAMYDPGDHPQGSPYQIRAHLSILLKISRN